MLIQYMPLQFHLRRVRHQGFVAPVFAHGSASPRGIVNVREEPDKNHRRCVRVATFERTDGGEPIPPLREVALVAAHGSWLVLTGVEEVLDDKLARPQQFAQSWQLLPAVDEEMIRMGDLLNRLIRRLRQLGVCVDMEPNWGAKIEGETPPEDAPTIATRGPRRFGKSRL
jgi:hypothetical protein